MDKGLIINTNFFFNGSSLNYDSSIIIEHGIITDIVYGKFVSKPDYEVIEAEFVMPGLVSAHEHLVGVGSGKKGIYTYLYNDLVLFLMHGILGLRDAGNTIQNIVMAKKISEELQLPYIVFSSPLFDRVPTSYLSIYIDDTNYKNLIYCFNHFRDFGLNFIKAYVTLDTELYKKIVDLGRSLGFKIGAHLWSTPLEEIIDTPYHPDIIDHIATIIQRKKLTGYNDLAKIWADHFDQGWIEEMAKKIKSKAIGVTTTLVNAAVVWGIEIGLREQLLDYVLFYNKFLNREETSKIVSEASGVNKSLGMKAWKNLVTATKILYQEGISLLPASDSPNTGVPPGEGFIKELIILNRQVGIKSLDILKYATSETTKFIGLDKYGLGIIKENTKPNIIILDGNPLNDIENLYKVKLIITDKFVLEPKRLELYPLGYSPSF